MVVKSMAIIIFVKVLTDKDLDSVHWLADIGVDFDCSEVSMPVGALWRRSHKPKQPMGYAFIEALDTYIRKNSGTILTDTAVTDFILENGLIKGVLAKGRNGQTITVHAQAVVLASVVLVPILRCYNNIILIGVILMITFKQRIHQL